MLKSSTPKLQMLALLKDKKYLLATVSILLLVTCTGPVANPNSSQPMAAITRTYPPATTNITVPTQVLTALPIATPTSENMLAISLAENEAVDLYGLLELSLQTNLLATNPYDPDEIELVVRFTAPSGREVDVGAFWYQGYDLKTRQVEGKPGWKVRFTPDEPGDWIAAAYARNLSLQSSPFLFHVAASNRSGFIRIHPTNPRYLAFENGDFFFPIGLNMAWWGGCCDPVDQYGQWFDLFTANGGNMIRVWMAAWSFGIEWKDTGLGDYDQRLYEAWLLDQLFRLADEHGVKIILVLMNHGPFSTSVNSEWNDNPYNVTLGGPLTRPEQFVSDSIAKSYYQRRLNYIVNRWGYSPDLLAWEWWNEVNLTPITDEDLIPWLKEMTAYLRQRDVNHHLTTSSYAMSCISPIWQLPDLDIAQKHEYSSQISASDHDLAGRAAQDFQAFAQTIPPKPILLGEFGYSASNYGDDIEQTGVHLHNGLWSTTFSGYAGSGMYWWWDNYIEANNLWYHFKGLSRFFEGEDLTKYQPFSPLEISERGGNYGQVDGLGLRGEGTLVWMRSDSYTVQTSITARDGKPASSGYIPPLLENLHLTLSEMANGEYTVKWYDPQMARWLDTATVTAQDNMLTIPIPPFRYDLAAKIIRNP